MENYLTTTFITRPEDDGSTIELKVSRIDYHNWIEEQEKYYNCKFYNKTNGSKTSDRKTKNEEYLRNGYTPPPPGQKCPRGKLGYIFNEVNC